MTAGCVALLEVMTQIQGITWGGGGDKWVQGLIPPPAGGNTALRGEVGVGSDGQCLGEKIQTQEQKEAG